MAPPYDVISAEERERYLALDPHNVVHLTLPDSEQEAARSLREWEAEGVLAAEAEPAVWALSQTYTGPDGIERTRNGLVMVKASGFTPASSRDQVMGAAMGNPSRARGEYAPIAVVPRPLRR